MLFFTKKFLITFLLGFFITSLGLSATTAETTTAEDVQETADDFQTLSVEGEAYDEDDLMNFDISTLRSLEEITDIQPGQLSLEDAIEAAKIFLSLKARIAQEKVINHFKNYSNEYLMGSVCIATIILAATVKHFSKANSDATTR